MFARLLSFAIITFWVVMTALLVQSVYFPESNRFSAVDPRHVARLFFANTDFHSLELKREGISIADVTLSGKIHDSEATGISYELRCHGSGTFRLPDVPPQRITTNLTFEFDTNFAITDYQLSVSLHKENARVEIMPSENGSGFDFTLIQDGEVIADSNNTANLPGVEEIAAITEGAGLGSPETIETSLRDFAKSIDIRGRRCQLDFGASTAPGFCLGIKLVEEDDVQLYFTESGELYRADSVFELELISDQIVEPAPRS
ncbi:MAG: hypothetical protein AAGA58_12235 [Verrucomicrobiota bacterium]